MREQSLRVMTWNIHGRVVLEIDALASEISALAPDIIGLQEIRCRQAALLAESLQMSQVWAFKHNPFWPVLETRAEGLAVLSRFPISRHNDTVLSTSARRRSYKRRIALMADIRIEDVDVTLVNTHLASHGDINERRRQAQTLRTYIDQYVTNPWILTADLNDHNEPDIAEILEGDTAHDAWASHNHQIDGHTCPSFHPSQRIDHVVLSQFFLVEDVFVPQPTPTLQTLSDHLPVVAVTHILGSAMPHQ